MTDVNALARAGEGILKTLPNELAANVRLGGNQDLQAQVLNTERLAQAVDDFRPELANALVTDVASAFAGRAQLNPTNTPTDDKVWQSSRYGSDFIPYAPKNGFLFKVKFQLNNPYTAVDTDFSYVVSSMDRPSIQYQYRDINLYNFKTKLLVGVTHLPIQMQFLDDIQNKVIDFFNFYHTAHSPIGNLDLNQTSQLEQSGMNFSSPGQFEEDGRPSHASSAGTGTLVGNNANLIKAITLSQIYGHGSRVVQFHFFNPRIEDLQLGSVDHSISDGNSVQMSFNYDSLFIEDNPMADGLNAAPGPTAGRYDVLGNQELTLRSNPGQLPPSDTPSGIRGLAGAVSHKLSARVGNPPPRTGNSRPDSSTNSILDQQTAQTQQNIVSGNQGGTAGETLFSRGLNNIRLRVS